MKLRRVFIVFCTSVLLALQLCAAGHAKHIVVIVWDGMRPDFVSHETTPTLWRLSREGVLFQNHHSVFVSSTEVNGAALGTGAYPRTSGIMANKEFRPAINPKKPVAIEDLDTIRQGDAVDHDQYIQVATVAEILRAQKPALYTAVVGSKPVAMLLDRKERPDDSPSRLLAEGKTLPTSDLAKITAANGPFPPIKNNKIDRDAWTSRALVNSVWAERVPAYTVLWLAEPDFTQHESGPGSTNALAAIKSSDDELKVVLESLAERKLLDETDVMVVSDHGFSTIERNADLVRDLSKAGLAAVRALAETSKQGEILVVGNGGSANLYIVGHEPDVIRKAVEVLQQQNYTGVLFTKEEIAGTFPLSLAKIDSKDAPDIVISFRWSSARSATGTRGLQVSESGGNRGPGEGNHASLSLYDLHNTLVAAGPDFRRGVTDPLPSGNTDLAPTILWILGVQPITPMDGRVLSEALIIPGPKLQSFEVSRHESIHEFGARTWRQYLTISEVNGVIYFDEGNGELTTR